MKITKITIEETTLKEFADSYNLELEFRSYKLEFNTSIQCSFKRSELKQGPGLLSTYGSGYTELRALNDYIRILNKHNGDMVINAMNDNRQEIFIPTIKKVKSLKDIERVAE